MEEGNRVDAMFRLYMKGMSQSGPPLVVSGYNITADADGTASKQYPDHSYMWHLALLLHLFLQVPYTL